MRILSVCRECSEVHPAGRDCPGCTGVPAEPMPYRTSEPNESIPRHFGLPHLVGALVGLVAAASVLAAVGAL